MAAYENNAIFWIEVEKIVPNPYQPRREFDQSKLKELSESIRMYGILQPLVVTRREIMREGGAFSTEYELIAGERRLRASKLAGLTQVPVIIRSGEESELMKLELAIIENLQREDLNAVDRALAFRQLSEHFGLSHTQVAQKVGRSREYVSNSIRLLLLPETILGALKVGDISDGHARTLLMLNDRPEEQDIVFREILLKKLSVREVERISRKIATEKVRKKVWQGTDPELIAIEREFTETLGTRVQISKTDYGGKLTIDYFSEDDLRKLLELVHRAEVKGAKTEALTTETLAAIAVATPLVTTFATETPERELDTEPVVKAYPEEEMFTRHDSLEMEVVPELEQELSRSLVDKSLSETIPSDAREEFLPPSDLHNDATVEPVLPQADEAPPEIADFPLKPIMHNREHNEFVEAEPAASETTPDHYSPTSATPVSFELPPQSVSPSTVATPEAAPTIPAQVQTEDEAELYSIKNFSL